MPNILLPETLSDVAYIPDHLSVLLPNEIALLLVGKILLAAFMEPKFNFRTSLLPFCQCLVLKEI